LTESCPGTTLCTTDPIWTSAGTNAGLRCERPATMRLDSGRVAESGLGLKRWEKFKEAKHRASYGRGTLVPQITAWLFLTLPRKRQKHLQH